MPAEAFQANPRLLWHFPVHVAVMAACFVAVGRAPLGVAPLFGIIIGHSMMCLVCLGHAITHGSVIRGRWKAPIESFVWAFASLPAIPWKRSHNEVHHQQTNTEKDFFRYFHTGEDTRVRRLVTLLFYPNRHLPWNPLTPLVLFVVVGNHALAEILPDRVKIPWMPARVRIRGLDKPRFLVEVALVIGIHVAFHQLGDGGLSHTIAVATAAYVAVALGMGYIFTQHSLHPIAASHDPVPYTTSIHVGRVADFLHFHMSCHVSHHLFESMNPDRQPEVEALVAEHFPDVYQRLPVGEAFRRLMQNPLLVAPPGGRGDVPVFSPDTLAPARAGAPSH